MDDIEEMRDRVLRYLYRMQTSEMDGATPGRLRSYLNLNQKDLGEVLNHMVDRGEIAILSPEIGGRGRKAPKIFCTKILRGPETTMELIDGSFTPKLTDDSNPMMEAHAKKTGFVDLSTDERLEGLDAVEHIRKTIHSMTKEFSGQYIKMGLSPTVSSAATELYLRRHSSSYYPEYWSIHRLKTEYHHGETFYESNPREPSPATMTRTQMALDRLLEVYLPRKNDEEAERTLERIVANGGLAELFPLPEWEMQDRDLDALLKNYTEEDLEDISVYGPLDATNPAILAYRMIHLVLLEDPKRSSGALVELMHEALTTKPALEDFEGF